MDWGGFRSLETDTLFGMLHSIRTQRAQHLPQSNVLPQENLLGLGNEHEVMKGVDQGGVPFLTEANRSLTPATAPQQPANRASGQR
jgi:hypothetical protein